MVDQLHNQNKWDSRPILNYSYTPLQQNYPLHRYSSFTLLMPPQVRATVMIKCFPESQTHRNLIPRSSLLSEGKGKQEHTQIENKKKQEHIMAVLSAKMICWFFFLRTSQHLHCVLSQKHTTQSNHTDATKRSATDSTQHSSLPHSISQVVPAQVDCVGIIHHNMILRLGTWFCKVDVGNFCVSVEG